MQTLNRALTRTNQKLPLKVMQFGGGNFLRAFADWMIQILNEEQAFNAGVAIIKPTEGGNYELLRSQEGLFTVVLTGVENGLLKHTTKLVTCVQEIVNPYEEWEAYLKLAQVETLRIIVSNTTEAGIRFSRNDSLGDRPPGEFPAKLTLWLYKRYQHFKGDPARGCILLPCELIQSNGQALMKAVLQYIEFWDLEKEFSDWISQANIFCDTLVDRIVSGYPENSGKEILNKLGYRDPLLVSGEYYHSWVIQGPAHLEEELPFAKAGLNVRWVKDLETYREMKVRILNGAHTAMVAVGYPAGLRSVGAVMEDAIVSTFIVSLLEKEVIQTMDQPLEERLQYTRKILDRFRNPALEHKLIDIALNSSAKLVSRILPTLKEFYTRFGRLPERTVFVLAAFIVFYSGRFASLKDEEKVIRFFSASWKSYEIGETNELAFVKTVLGNKQIWGEDLNQIEGLTPMIKEYLKGIQAKGIVETLKKNKLL